jgi:hypothetical protein
MPYTPSMSLGPVAIVFCTSYYDMPLAGLCRHNGQLCWFIGDYDTGTYTLYRLSEAEQTLEQAHQALFEELVGTHWSYEVPREERVQRPRELQRKFYERPERQAVQERQKQYVTDDGLLGQFTKFANSLQRH